MAKKPDIKPVRQGKAIVELSDGLYYAMLPDGSIETATTAKQIEAKIKAWTKKSLPKKGEYAGILMVEWRGGAKPPSTSSKKIKAGSLDELYGGLPEVGGYGHYTEYEIGAGLTAEAAHCILGSLSRAITHGHWDIEIGHISEEVRTIEKNFNEYSHDIYTGRVWQDNRYVDKSRDSIRKASVKLARIAATKRKGLDKNLPKEVFNLAFLTYWFVEELAKKMGISVDTEPPRNVFNDKPLRGIIQQLRSAAGDYKRFAETTSQQRSASMDRSRVAGELLKVAKLLVGYMGKVEVYLPGLTYQYDSKGEIDTSALGGGTILVHPDDLANAPKMFKQKFMARWKEHGKDKQAWNRLVELVKKYYKPGNAWPSSTGYPWIVGLSRKIPQRYVDSANRIKLDMAKSKVKRVNLEKFKQDNADLIQKYLKRYKTSESAWEAEDETAWSVLYQAGY